MDEVEDQISDLENKVPENTQSEHQREKNFLINNNLKNICDNMKHNSNFIIGLPGEEREREQGMENLFEEIMTENFPNLVKEEDTQVQECREPQTRCIQRDPHQDT